MRQDLVARRDHDDGNHDDGNHDHERAGYRQPRQHRRARRSKPGRLASNRPCPQHSQRRLRQRDQAGRANFREHPVLRGAVRGQQPQLLEPPPVRAEFERGEICFDATLAIMEVIDLHAG